MHDVLIVLGYSTDPDDTVVKSRVAKAVELYQQSLAPQVIMSGCCSDKLDIRPATSEAAVMRDQAIDLGIPSSAILLEEESVDTLGNFYYCRQRYLEPCSWYNVGFVSTPWHSVRAAYLASMVLGPDYEVTAYASDHPRHWQDTDIAESERYNQALLSRARQQLGKLTPGDLEAIADHLGTAPRKR